MNKIAILVIATCLCLSTYSQVNQVKGKLSTSDTADLTILNIYPDSFPNISVVFRAETRTGEPVWNLSREKMIVKENRENCNVVSLEQISKNQPINLGIVIDHSGSMQEDNSVLYDKAGNALYQFDENYRLIYPEGYKAPIEHAKNAVKKFVKSFNSKKDFISITGFSSVVDKKLPLTQDVIKINAIVDSMQADFSTALYDAINNSIEEVKKSSGVKVLVVLTDGYDNSSTSTWKDVVKNAVKENIPVYIIGLGNVNKDTLELIAKSTHGQFYFTKSSSSLDTVYTQISKQVQAFYNLVYSSPSLSSADSVRQIEVSFDIDSLKLVTKPGELKLPAELITYLSKKEKQKQYMMLGGIAVILLISTGTLLFYYQKKKNGNPVIKKLFPNPSNGNINIEFTGDTGELQIVNSTGQVVKTLKISGSESNIDLTNLPHGNYWATVFSKGKNSNTIPFVIEY